MPPEADAIRVVDIWYGSLRSYQDKLPARGSLTAALHVLNQLRSKYNLDISAHVADGGAQIKGLTEQVIASILVEFGENRELSRTAGRTNRGNPGAVKRLLEMMRPLRLDELAVSERQRALKAMQKHIVANYVGLYFSLKRVKVTFDPNATTRRCIQSILQNAGASGKGGAVAEYLVGAKLSLRFPDKPIRNKKSSSADAQSGHAGDFELGDTAFHVTIAPMPGLFNKCKENLDRGLRVYLLVPEALATGARQNADLLAEGRIAVESIESFVATNIDELAEFDGERLKSGFRRLLERYNERVVSVELDKSMLIEIPPNLE